jgi:hypothetical protein
MADFSHGLLALRAPPHQILEQRPRLKLGSLRQPNRDLPGGTGRGGRPPPQRVNCGRRAASSNVKVFRFHGVNLPEMAEW